MSIASLVKLVALGAVLGIAAWAATDVLMRDWLVRRHERAMTSYEAEYDDHLDVLEKWLANGDPLSGVPACEMGVGISYADQDELVCLAVELWPRNEYLAFVDLYVTGGAS